MCGITSLPYELLHIILSYLDLVPRLRLSVTCKQLRSVLSPVNFASILVKDIQGRRSLSFIASQSSTLPSLVRDICIVYGDRPKAASFRNGDLFLASHFKHLESLEISSKYDETKQNQRAMIKETLKPGISTMFPMLRKCSLSFCNYTYNYPHWPLEQALPILCLPTLTHLRLSQVSLSDRKANFLNRQLSALVPERIQASNISHLVIADFSGSHENLRKLLRPLRKLTHLWLCNGPSRTLLSPEVRAEWTQTLETRKESLKSLRIEGSSDAHFMLLDPSLKPIDLSGLKKLELLCCDSSWFLGIRILSGLGKCLPEKLSMMVFDDFYSASCANAPQLQMFLEEVVRDAPNLKTIWMVGPDEYYGGARFGLEVSLRQRLGEAYRSPQQRVEDVLTQKSNESKHLQGPQLYLKLRNKTKCDLYGDLLSEYRDASTQV